MILVSIFTSSAYAMESSVNLVYKNGLKPIDKVTFRLFKIAEKAEDKYVWSEDLAKYNLSLEIINKNLAETVSSYISRDNLKPINTVSTNNDGKATFNIEESGLYLINADEYKQENFMYYPVPVMFLIDENNKSYDIEIKHESKLITPEPTPSPTPGPGPSPIPHPTPSPEPSTNPSNPLVSSNSYISIKVLKHWEGDYEETPNQVNIELLRNGKTYKEAILDENNGWKTIFRDLPSYYKYDIIEVDTDEAYRCEIEKDGNLFIVTNTYIAENIDDGDTPKTDTPEIPSPSPTPIPSPIPSPDGSQNIPSEQPIPSMPMEEITLETNPESGIPEKLPQTGRKWMPIIISMIVAILLLLIAVFVPNMKVKIALVLISLCIIVLVTNTFIGFDKENESLKENNSKIVMELDKQIQDNKKENEEFSSIPDYAITGTETMPETKIDNLDYIGYLEIPKLDLKLPVQSEWTNKNGKLSPCRYIGSVYTDDLVIAGHNYKAMFGTLNNLDKSDILYFVDIDGNKFTYQVEEKEEINGTDIKKMTEWNKGITLFTCTLDSTRRITIRGTRIQQEVSSYE